MTIKIKTITETTAELFNSKGKNIGLITSYVQLNDVRCQIHQTNTEGYYLIWLGISGKEHPIQLNIDKNGRIDHWPNGFFDETDNQLEILLDL